MSKTKCNICKANNNEMTCMRCGAILGELSTEYLILSSDGATLSKNSKNNNVFSRCKIAFTNRRLVIYKIKPEADNPAFGLFKDLANAIIKNPYISINLNDIEYIRRYGIKYVIVTKIYSYCVWLNKSEEFDKLLVTYKLRGEK